MKLDPKMMRKAMSQLGMSQEELAAKEVRIVLDGKQLVFPAPNVIRVKMGGEMMYQITGAAEERPLETTPAEPSKDDIATVMEQTGCTEEQAKTALDEHELDLAAAILALKKE